MTDKQSDEYGFMARLDSAGLIVTDSSGGSRRVAADTRTEVVSAIADYIRRCADLFAEDMADDLFDEDDSEDDDDDSDDG